MSIKGLLNTIAKEDWNKVNFILVKDNKLSAFKADNSKCFMTKFGAYKVEQITICNHKLIVNVNERK